MELIVILALLMTSNEQQFESAVHLQPTSIILAQNIDFNSPKALKGGIQEEPSADSKWGYDGVGDFSFPDGTPFQSHAMGNIAPYRKVLLLRIARRLRKPSPRGLSCRIDLLIGGEGDFRSATILESSGNKAWDEYVLSVLERMPYSPLPSWYKGESVVFKIDTAKLAAIQEDMSEMDVYIDPAKAPEPSIQDQLRQYVKNTVAKPTELCWFPPPDARKQPVTVEFKILHSGALTELQVTKPNTDSRVNEAALGAIRNGSIYYKPLPRQMDTISVEVEFNDGVKAQLLPVKKGP